ncbi:fimbrial protein [Salmonella enterica]|nr:fimbrial protein [Salmonella enterica]
MSLWQPNSLLMVFLTVFITKYAVADNIVSVQVNVIAPPPCTINNDINISVEFGTLLTEKVNGVNYRKPIDYTIECNGQVSDDMRLMIQAKAATFDNSAISTNINDFAVSIESSGQKISLNEWHNFRYPDMPILYAVPVKNKDSRLGAGDFTASATLLVAYQ